MVAQGRHLVGVTAQDRADVVEAQPQLAEHEDVLQPQELRALVEPQPPVSGAGGRQQPDVVVVPQGA